MNSAWILLCQLFSYCCILFFTRLTHPPQHTHTRPRRQEMSQFYQSSEESPPDRMSSSENVISAGTTSKEKKNEEHEENLSMKLDKFYRFKPISRPNIAYGSVAQHLTTREYSDRGVSNQRSYTDSGFGSVLCCFMSHNTNGNTAN